MSTSLRAKSKTRPGRSVLLTFDDARKSFGDVALPLLRQYRCPCCLFAPYVLDAVAAACRG